MKINKIMTIAVIMLGLTATVFAASTRVVWEAETAKIENGNSLPIQTIDLILSIISLNVILFLACPIIKKITGVSEDDFRVMLQRRKKENVIMIINSLRPLESQTEKSIL